jgi:CubicO group peptidase (beta-lactamase class C family)
MNTDRLAAAVELVRARGSRAQFCVLRNGKVLVDQAYGGQPDDLFWIFSASKPFVAVLIHLLAERGVITLDDPVAAHWPGFARHGKEDITIRQVLSHRAGIPVACDTLRDGLAMTDWDRSIRLVERARPIYPAGEVAAYHAVTYGFVLGELIRRVTGRAVGEFLVAELSQPLALRDTHLGLPPALWRRHVPVRGRGTLERTTAYFANRPALRRAVIPAAGISTTARDLARFYQALLAGDVLRPETLDHARRLSSRPGEIDRVAKVPIRWGHGFQLGGAATDGWASPMGRLSSPEAFGHNGSNTCLAWADPSRGLVFAYLTNLLTPRRDGGGHLSAVSDAVLAAYD